MGALKGRGEGECTEEGGGKRPPMPGPGGGVRPDVLNVTRRRWRKVGDGGAGTARCIVRETHAELLT